MRYVASVAETRAADSSASARVGEAALIARASYGVAVECARLLGSVYAARVVVIAGSGHNAADAMRAGRTLQRWGASVVVVRSSERTGDDHWTSAAAGLRFEPDVPADVDLVVDGMTGVGFAGSLRGRAADLADRVADLGAPVVAVDVPSGVDADTGAVDGPAVQAVLTVTFDRLKHGHVVGPGAERCGEVVVVPVGLDFAATSPAGVLDADDVGALLPEPSATADKYSRGVVGIVAGSEQYPGAAVLCTGGAVRGGAGYVRYTGHAEDAVRAAWPTVVVGEGRVDAYVCGSGAPSDDDVRRVVESDVPAVLDAGALSDAVRGRTAPTLITPHAGEFERLTGVDPASDPLGAARRAAEQLGVHVLLKGQRTVVAAPDGRALVNPTGTTWLSTAGTGDVLAGVAGALMAAAVKRGSLDVLEVGAAAAFLHGLAGRFAPHPLAASDLLDAWPAAVDACRLG